MTTITISDEVNELLRHFCEYGASRTAVVDLAIRAFIARELHANRGLRDAFERVPSPKLVRLRRP